MADHQRIRGFTVWPDEDFPRTHTLKVKKRVLADTLLGADGDAPAPAAPQAGGGDEPTLERLIAEVAEVSVAEVTAGKSLAGDLDMDSLKRVELLSAIEEELGVYLDEDALDPGTTVDALAVMVARRLPQPGGEELHELGTELVVPTAAGGGPAGARLPAAALALPPQGRRCA